MRKRRDIPVIKAPNSPRGRGRPSKQSKVKKSYLYKPPEARDLSDLQMRFCEEYIVDLNGVQSAIRAGYSQASAGIQASKLLANTSIIRYIQHLKIERAKRLEVSQDRIVQELARIAYSDHRTFYDKEGWPIPIEMLTDDHQASVRDVQWGEEVQKDRTGQNIKDQNNQDKIFRYVKKYAFYNRVDALRMLGHHLGMSLDKPSERFTGKDKPQQEITFEQLIRRLDAAKLEQLTKWLIQAAKPIETAAPVQKEEEPEWIDNTLGGIQ